MSVCFRFNELRKVRSKPKAAGTERPFSRMYNFFVLERGVGDKCGWAQTGTRFKPRNALGYPRHATVIRSAESKKERNTKRPGMAPQLATAPEAAACTQETPSQATPTHSACSGWELEPFSWESLCGRQIKTAKMTPHAIRPIGVENLRIAGNRPSPPLQSERSRLNDWMFNAGEEPAINTERIQQLQVKRGRCEEMCMDMCARQPLDLPPLVHCPDYTVSARRRLCTVEANAPYPDYPHSSSHSHHHHHSITPLSKAEQDEQDEQAYLYRMRPDVGVGWMAPVHNAGMLVHSMQHMHTCASTVSAAARQMKNVDAM